MLLLALALALAAQPIVVDVQGVGCAGAAALAEVVNARAGPGSVVDEGPRLVEVRYQLRPLSSTTGVAADVRLIVDGVPRGARRLGPFPQCGALEDALALTLSLIVDPLLPPAPTATSTTTTTTNIDTAAPLAAELRVPLRASGGRAPLQVQGVVGVGVAGGFAPGFGPSGLVRLRLGVGWLGVGVGARFDLPAPLIVDGERRLESGAAAAVVDGCFVRQLFDGGGDVDVEACGVLEAGALRAVGIGFSQPIPTVAQVMTAGGAVGVTVPLWGGLGLHSRLGVAVPVLGARLLDGAGGVVWSSPPLTLQWLVGISAVTAGQ